VTEPSHPYTILDVFTDKPLTGNPLAVFTAGEEIPSRLMQITARELNLSETVFLLPGDHDADASVRIFTPSAELPFAGHPVLGAAFVVGGKNDHHTHGDVVRVRTGAGIVPVVLRREDGEVVYGEMEQPKPTLNAFPDPTALLHALGVAGAELPVEVYSNGPKHVMVALSSPEQVAALTPDMSALVRAGTDVDLPRLGVNCFAKVSDGHFKTRNFSPALGVAEDPATGSAAGPLALHLVRHGWTMPGEEIEIVQGVEINRPSRLRARIDGDPDDPTKIAVGGSAVTVAHGHFRLSA
jgi:trans-2,3-dihydro-3-hydroxyanthranilate isomerase